jgi:choice-of-anchor A domain-containing protein
MPGGVGGARWSITIVPYPDCTREKFTMKPVTKPSQFTDLIRPLLARLRIANAFALAIVLMMTGALPVTAFAQASNSPLGPMTSGCVGAACPPTYDKTDPWGNVASVANCGTSPIGRDEAYSIYAGGTFTVTAGAEGEGRFYVKGNLNAGTLMYNIVAVGVGSCVVPPDSLQPHVESGANISGSDVRVGELYNLHSDVKAVGSIAATVSTQGAKTPNTTINPEPISFATLQARSDDWAALPTTGTAVVDPWTVTFTGNGTSALQVFDLVLNGGNNRVVSFANIPTTATVLINVESASAVTIPTDDFCDLANKGGMQFSGDLTRRILWNFPNAPSVSLTGSSQFRGSVLVPRGNLTMAVLGLNGRVLVSGNIVQNRGGSEFHNFDFIGTCPCHLRPTSKSARSWTMPPRTWAKTSPSP